MRRLHHLYPVYHPLLSSPRPSVCLLCQHSLRPPPITKFSFTTSTRLPERLSTTERLRRKIWGTNTPPGAADPYAPREVDADPVLSEAPVEEQQQQQQQQQPEPRGRKRRGTGAKAKRESKQAARQRARVEMQRKIDKAPKHPQYRPATSWEGLQAIGGEEELPDGKVFDGGFLGDARVPSKLDTTEEVTAAVYRAVVEVFATMAAGKQPRVGRDYAATPLLNATRYVRIAGDVGGTGEFEDVELHFPDKRVETAVCYPKVAAAQAQEEEARQVAEEVASAPSTTELFERENDGAVVSGEETDTLTSVAPSTAARHLLTAGEAGYSVDSLRAEIDSWGQTWRRISLADPKVRFAIVKRVMRILGRPVADPVITRSATVGTLVSELTRGKDAPKLHDRLVADTELSKLSNVDLRAKKRTEKDRETDVGRWKVIREELLRRGLPVYATRA